MRALQPLFRVLSVGKLSILLFHKVPLSASRLAPHELDLAAVTRIVDAAQALFRVIPLSDAVAALRGGTLPPRAACITFDDGYADWAQGIVPVLQQRGLHATFFITTGQFHGQPVWSERILHAISAAPDALHRLQLDSPGLEGLPLATADQRREAVALLEARLKYMDLHERDDLLAQLEASCNVVPGEVTVMSAQDLRALHSAGFGIGGHTVAHPILARCRAEAAYREIAGCKEQLEGLIGGRVEGFAYPNGIPSKDFDASHVEMVKRAGYDYAVTTFWGTAAAKHSLFQIPRFTPWGPSFGKMAGQLGRNLLRRASALPETSGVAGAPSGSNPGVERS